MRKIIGALAVWLALCGAALAQTCPGLPFTFTANTTIRSAQVNSNFTSLLTCQNTLLAPLASPVFTGSVTIPTLGVTGTETVGSTLSVTGAATFGSTVGVTGATTHSGTVTMSGAAANEAFGTIASAATTNIGAAAANYLQVTGTTGITAFDTIQAGTERTLEFAGALTLTNSANVILLGGGNYTTAAGDVLKFRSEGAGVWRQATLGQAKGLPVLNKQVFTGNGTFTTPANTNANTVFKFTVIGGGGGGGGGSGSAAGGGGSGATAYFWGSGVAAGSTAAVTIGGSGSGGSGTSTGGTGGSSTVVFNGTTITCTGGTGGINASGGGNGGAATNGTLNIPGQGGNALTSATVGGAGGSSLMGAGAGSGGGAGSAGGSFGGGGGGGGAGNAGGAGAAGVVLVEWVQ